jgi:hypothetical protein
MECEIIAKIAVPDVREHLTAAIDELAITEKTKAS